MCTFKLLYVNFSEFGVPFKGFLLFYDLQALRFFVGEPVWTPHNRPNDHLPARYDLINLIVNETIRCSFAKPHSIV